MPLTLSNSFIAKNGITHLRYILPNITTTTVILSLLMDLSLIKTELAKFTPS